MHLGGEAVPLKSVHVRATLLDMVARVVVLQVHFIIDSHHNLLNCYYLCYLALL